MDEAVGRAVKQKRQSEPPLSRIERGGEKVLRTVCFPGAAVRIDLCASEVSKGDDEADGAVVLEVGEKRHTVLPLSRIDRGHVKFLCAVCFPEIVVRIDAFKSDLQVDLIWSGSRPPYSNPRIVEGVSVKEAGFHQ
ncbi:MAG: hypothetical protein GY820_46960, partial [Gammaproteobacteria bacterium]|nr:hypothetical protein [Gammaproteobacteria bacterium]